MSGPLIQAGMTILGLTSLWMALGKSARARRWAPLVGLAGQPLWAMHAMAAHAAGVDAWGLAVMVTAYTAVYARGAWVQWRPLWPSR